MQKQQDQLKNASMKQMVKNQEMEVEDKKRREQAEKEQEQRVQVERNEQVKSQMKEGIQQTKEQLQNKLKAMEVLRARLLDAKIAEQEAARARMRKTQVGTGDRSAKIRTYNYPQNRVTDHRINLTLHELTKVLNGEIEPFIEALKVADVEERLGE